MFLCFQGCVYQVSATPSGQNFICFPVFIHLQWVFTSASSFPFRFWLLYPLGDGGDMFWVEFYQWLLSIPWLVLGKSFLKVLPSLSHEYLVGFLEVECEGGCQLVYVCHPQRLHTLTVSSY